MPFTVLLTSVWNIVREKVFILQEPNVQMNQTPNVRQFTFILHPDVWNFLFVLIDPIQCSVTWSQPNLLGHMVLL